MLISPDELAGRLESTDLRVVDVRWYLNRPGDGWRAYEAGHIPGAMFLDLDADLSSAKGDGRHPLPRPPEFRQRLESLGIGSWHHVVAYDDSGGTTAARLWWMLDNLGHQRVAVLDGGIAAWVASGHQLVPGTQPRYPPARLQLREQWTRVVQRTALAERLGTLTLLDARAPERYRGEVEPIDPAAGHIPTALSAPTAGNLDQTGRFRPAAELRQRFTELGAAGGEVVTSCGSGTTACHHALAMRVAGLPDPILYVGSFSDWSSAGMPVATGPEPGKPPRH